MQYTGVDVNRTIADWNQLPGGVIGTTPVKTHIFKKRVKKAKPVR
jgi:hypothetical protein